MSKHRMIYADELYETLANKLTWLMKYGNYVYLKVGRDIEEAISEQPTAYDIDKVIEQLEELEKEHPYKVIGQPDTYSQYNEAWQDCMDRVLGIVKRGGVK